MNQRNHSLEKENSERDRPVFFYELLHPRTRRQNDWQNDQAGNVQSKDEGGSHVKEADPLVAAEAKVYARYRHGALQRDDACIVEVEQNVEDARGVATKGVVHKAQEEADDRSEGSHQVNILVHFRLPVEPRIGVVDVVEGVHRGQQMGPHVPSFIVQRKDALDTIQYSQLFAVSSRDVRIEDQPFRRSGTIHSRCTATAHLNCE